MPLVVTTNLRLLSAPDVDNNLNIYLQRQIKLVSGHLLRLAASGAELARVLEYLRSGLEDENMHFLQLNPGFVSFGSQGTL